MHNSIVVETAKRAAKATTFIDWNSGTLGLAATGMPTASRVPVSADAGMVPETVWGAVNVVSTETQLEPSQYSMTLALVKVGLEIVTVTSTPEPRAAPLVEVTLTS